MHSMSWGIGKAEIIILFILLLILFVFYQIFSRLLKRK